MEFTSVGVRNSTCGLNTSVPYLQDHRIPWKQNKPSYTLFCAILPTQPGLERRGRSGGKELNKVTYASLIPKRAFYTSLFKGRREKFCFPLPEKGW